MSEEQIAVIKALLEETFQAGFYEYFSLQYLASSR